MPEPIIWSIVAIVALLIGGTIGYVLTRYVIKTGARNAMAEAERTLADAEHQAEALKKEALVEAKDAAHRLRSETDQELTERRNDIKNLENRLLQREETLDKRLESLDTRDHQLSSLGGQLERRQRDLETAEASIQENLEQIARMSTDEAKNELLNRVKGDVVKQEAKILREAEEHTRTEADKISRKIVSLAIQRVAADHTAENTVSSVSIPSDDVKGRIIGREGRNIRSFEQITGINLIIDDTPEVVVISSFDPVRREIGRLTLENLIADGRIHPARIEETFKKATEFVNQQVIEAGNQVAFDAGIHDLHPELIRTLGRLKYRTSYRQNVLAHSLEVAHLAGV
ncbi:MAG: Rnase Y domain-containing protein, partial [Coriobacteriales bacterium]|nr:Rnase Y domain-containing protein [Coriobacteriales bacterium]